MIGVALKKLAAENGLQVEKGAAYGMLQGCFVTLTEGAGYKRMSIYVGEAEEIPAEEAPQESRAAQIAGLIADASGEDNVYRLMTKHKNIAPLVVNHSCRVVTVNFFDNPGTMPCIEKFIAEVLPLVAPLTTPRQCICCSGDAAEYPVMIAADTVVPMHSSCANSAITSHGENAPKGNVFTGAIGALIGALLGAVVWAVVYCFGYMASLVGLLIGFLSSKGYDLLKGRPGVVKMIVVAICVIIAVAAGNIGAYGWTLHQVYVEAVADLKPWEVAVPETEYFSGVIGELMADSEFIGEMTKDMLTGLFFALLGCIDVFRASLTGSSEASKPRILSGQL